MRNILLNPDITGTRKVKTMDGFEILSITNKVLYGYDGGAYVVPVEDAPYGPGIYVNLGEEAEKADIEIGEDCYDEFCGLGIIPSGDVESANKIDFDYNGLNYKYLVATFSKGSALFSYDQTEGTYETLPVFLAKEENEVYTGVYNLSNGYSFSITYIKYNNGILRYYDENDNNHFGGYIQTKLYDVIEGHELAYYLNCESFDKFGNNNWKEDAVCEYLGNGNYRVEWWGGDFWPEQGEAIAFGPGGNYQYYPCVYKSDSTSEMTVITSAGTTAQESLYKLQYIGNNGNVVFAGCVREHWTNKALYTGTTWDNLTWAIGGNNAGLYFYNYTILKLEKRDTRSIMLHPVPGVAYLSRERKVFYNQGGAVILNDDGEAVYEIKSKKVVFDDKTITDIYLNHNFDGCGEIYVGKDCVESVSVEYYDGTRRDITQEIKDGTCTNLNVWRFGYFDTTSTSWDKRVFCKSIEVTFTDKFMKGGRLVGRTEQCSE